MKLIVKKVSQRGYQEKLGTSAVTIDQYGCNLACHTMLQNYYGNKIDIVSLNNLFKEKGVYFDRNLIDLFKIDKVNEFVKGKEYIDCILTPAPLKKIDTELTEGRPVIAQVDLNPNQTGPDHFILIIGKTEDGHYLCYDPWFKDEDAIFFDARYGEPSKGIYGLRLVTGPVPQPEVQQPTTDNLKTQIEQLSRTIDDIKESLRPVGIMPLTEIHEVIGKITELIGLKKEYEEHLKQDESNLEKPDIKHEGYVFNGKWDVGNWLIEFYKKEVSDK